MICHKSLVTEKLMIRCSDVSWIRRQWQSGNEGADLTKDGEGSVPAGVGSSERVIGGSKGRTPRRICWHAENAPSARFAVDRKEAKNRNGQFPRCLFHHHHQFNVHVIPRLIKGMDGCFPTAYGRQPAFNDLFTKWQLSIHGNVGTSFWWPDVLPDVN